MKLQNLIRVAVCALMLMFVAEGALAQKSSSKGKEEVAYPNATRKEPKPDMSEKSQRDLNKANDLIADGKDDEALALIAKVTEDKRAKPYALAFAKLLEGQVLWGKDDGVGAIAALNEAVQMDALPNSNHFDAMYQIAQLQLQEEKYADALATLDRYTRESGKNTADTQAIRANVYYRMDKFQEAAAEMTKAIGMTSEPKDSWFQILVASYFELDQYDQAAQVLQQQLAKDPQNKKLINQLATVYINADKPDQAIAVMVKAKNDGLISTGEDYLQLAKLYASGEKHKEAAAVLKEGLDKGIIQPGYEPWRLLGDVCSQADDETCAIDAYAKASPFAKDGYVDFQRGYALYYQERYPEAKQALDAALAKGGLSQEGEAYILRGDASDAAGQSAAAVADWEKAAQFPSSKQMAEQRLKIVRAGQKLARPSKK